MTDVIAFDLCVFDGEVLHFDMGPDVLTVGDRDISCVGVFVALDFFLFFDWIWKIEKV